MAEKTIFCSDSNAAHFATFSDATSTAAEDATAVKPSSLSLHEVNKPSTEEAFHESHNFSQQEPQTTQRPQHLLPPPYPFLPSPLDFSPQEIPFFLNYPSSNSNNVFNNNNISSFNNMNNVFNNNNNIEQQLKKLNLSPNSDEMKSVKNSLNNSNSNNNSNVDINSLFFNKSEATASFNNNNNNFNNLPSDPESRDLFAKLQQQRYINTDYNVYDQSANMPTTTTPYNNNQLSDALLMKLRQQQQLQQQSLLDFNMANIKGGARPPLATATGNSNNNNNPAYNLNQDAVTKLYLSEFLKGCNMGRGGFGTNHIECYSRKVFVGGLPPDSDENEITASFRQFGPLIIDWPHKAETKTAFPPKGYCFLLFQDEMSVQRLMEACMEEEGKFYWCISSTSTKDKPARRVQIRPWCLVDSDFLMDASQPLDLRKTIFVGGVPRPLRAVELALSMEQLYGGVCYAGIDTDPELKYPKGAGRVSFSRQQSYIAAISARFVQLQFGDIDKRVEVKPYVLDDQLCDECQGQKSAGKSAPYFCANVACLQYYCENCWVQIHSRAGREMHKPLVKEGADRPKCIPPFKW